MNYNLTPIETVYKGYKFRSRLEARWAVFFEEMGLDWSYEVEGFNLPSGARYLPDFFIKNHENCYDYWYEVKPKGAEPCPKVKEFADLLRQDSFNYSLNPFAPSNIQRIIQLNGAPMEVISSVCPRCKKISSGTDDLPDLNYSFYRETVLVLNNTVRMVPVPFKYNCNECDFTKLLNSDFDLEENGFRYKGNKSDLRWHKGEMEEDDDAGWFDLYSDILSSGLKARQERFDGRPTS